MSNRTYVCFECRTTERVPIARLTRDCRICHAPAEHVYYRFRIPTRDDDKGWRELRQRVREVNDRIKAGAVASLRGKVERYSRILASARPRRQPKLRREMEAAQELLSKFERWP